MTGGQNGVVGAAEKDTRDTAVDADGLRDGLAEHDSHIGDVEANN